MADDVKLHGETNPVTALVWRLGESEDPDDYYSSVPYEKVIVFGLRLRLVYVSVEFCAAFGMLIVSRLNGSGCDNRWP